MLERTSGLFQDPAVGRYREVAHLDIVPPRAAIRLPMWLVSPHNTRFCSSRWQSRGALTRHRRPSSLDACTQTCSAARTASGAHISAITIAQKLGGEARREEHAPRRAVRGNVALEEKDPIRSDHRVPPDCC